MSLSVMVVVERSVRSRYFEAALPLMQARGIDIACVMLAPAGPLNAALADRGVSSTALQCRSVADYPVAVGRLARMAHRHRPEVIHAHEAIPAAIAGAGGRIGSPRSIRLFHRHHVHVRGVWRAFSYLASRACTTTVVVSHAARAAAVDTDGVEQDDVLVAYNGVEAPRPVKPDEIAALRATHLATPNGRLIVAVARLRPEKGIDDLIQAGAMLQDNGVRVIIVGGGPEEARLRAIAEDLRVQIGFVGPQDDVAPWFAAADVIAMPSHSESFGLVAIEAMAAGRPLVACGVEGLAEVIEDGRTGILVPPRDPRALSVAIAGLLKDPARATAIAAGGRERWRDGFTIDAMVDGWLTAYRRCMERA